MTDLPVLPLQFGFAFDVHVGRASNWHPVPCPQPVPISAPVQSRAPTAEQKATAWVYVASEKHPVNPPASLSLNTKHPRTGSGGKKMDVLLATSASAQQVTAHRSLGAAYLPWPGSRREFPCIRSCPGQLFVAEGAPVGAGVAGATVGGGLMLHPGLSCKHKRLQRNTVVSGRAMAGGAYVFGHRREGRRA
jgi:hypothetical protein